MRVPKIADVVGDLITMVTRLPWPSADSQLATLLVNLNELTDPDPHTGWVLPITIGDKEAARTIYIDLVKVLSAEEYRQSIVEPHPILPRTTNGPEHHPFLFRDRFFLTDRAIVTDADYEEAILRVKKAVYDAEGEINALRLYVGNIEAAVEFQRSGPRREPIPDDVKVLVWSRDGGVCTRCGSNEKLHFDHVIPVVKGGGNDANNIQLLCQVCNLKKSDRIAF